ncbi:MAG TPA: PilN domain-containing protein [Myxococcota bacterium]|jgi:type IV pilus assembly protein PilN
MITINLLPVREARRKAGARQFLLVIAASVAASVALSSVHHVWFRSEVAGAKKAAARIQTEIDGYAPQLAQVEKFRAAKADIEKKLRVIDELSVARSGPVHLFDEIATHLPDRMWLTKLEVEGQQLTIEGVSLDNELVALFLTAMNASPHFADVELLETQAKDVDGYKLNAFQMSAVLEGAAPSDADAKNPAAAKHATASAASPALAAR